MGIRWDCDVRHILPVFGKIKAAASRQSIARDVLIDGATAPATSQSSGLADSNF